MRVGIVGGGVAGVTLAAALVRKGIEFDLFERASAFAPVGAGIALMPPALRVADQLGLSKALRDVSVALPTMRWLSASGRILLEISYPGIWQQREVRSVHRHQLHEVLLSVVPRERIHLGTTVTSLANVNGGVELGLASGETSHFDVVVGADGVHSRVRSIVERDRRPHYLGQNYWRATLDRDDLAESYTLVVAAGHSLGMTPVSRGRTHFFAQQVSAEPLDEPLDGRLDRLRQRFADCGHLAALALQTLRADSDIHFGHGYELPALSQPATHASVVLIGDADHATSPNLGVGGAMAMEDALVLADELVHASLGAALASYRARRLPRIEWVQRRTLAWVQRMRSGERVTDPASIYRQDYALLLEEP